MIGHLSDDDIERYVLDLAAAAETCPIETHLFNCHFCAQRTLETASCLEAIRAAFLSLHSEGGRVAQGEL